MKSEFLLAICILISDQGFMLEVKGAIPGNWWELLNSTKWVVIKLDSWDGNFFSLLNLNSTICAFEVSVCHAILPNW